MTDAFIRAAARDRRTSGMTVRELAILLHLDSARRPWGTKDLTREFRLPSRGVVTRAVQSLQAAGYVLNAVDAHDKRQRDITITAAGKAMLDAWRSVQPTKGKAA